MAPILPTQNLAFRPGKNSLEPYSLTWIPTAKHVIDPLEALDEGPLSVDVTYKVVWTAGEPPSSPSRRPTPAEWIAAHRMAGGQPPDWPPKPCGAVRITGSAVEGSIWSRLQPQNNPPSGSTPQPIPEGKIPCIAMLHRETLGALSTCLYDKATDSFSHFSADDGTWAHRKGYKDYGDVQMSTKKWLQGSWISVKDDNGNDFLFLTIERDFGIVRVWRPNMVAKRIVGSGETELTNEEIMRLRLNEDDGF